MLALTDPACTTESHVLPLFAFPVQLQIVSGVGLEAFWLSSFVWDFVSYLIPMSFAIILFKLAGLSPLLDNGAVYALILLFLLFGLSMVSQDKTSKNDVFRVVRILVEGNVSACLVCCCLATRPTLTLSCLRREDIDFRFPLRTV